MLKSVEYRPSYDALHIEPTINAVVTFKQALSLTLLHITPKILPLPLLFLEIFI